MSSGCCKQEFFHLPNCKKILITIQQAEWINQTLGLLISTSKLNKKLDKSHQGGQKHPKMNNPLHS